MPIEKDELDAGDFPESDVREPAWRPAVDVVHGRLESGPCYGRDAGIAPIFIPGCRKADLREARNRILAKSAQPGGALFAEALLQESEVRQINVPFFLHFDHAASP